MLSVSRAVFVMTERRLVVDAVSVACCVCYDRALYRQFVDEVIIKPGTRHFQSSRSDVTMDDHVCL